MSVIDDSFINELRSAGSMSALPELVHVPGGRSYELAELDRNKTVGETIIPAVVRVREHGCKNACLVFLTDLEGSLDFIELQAHASTGKTIFPSEGYVDAKEMVGSVIREHYLVPEQFTLRGDSHYSRIVFFRHLLISRAYAAANKNKSSAAKLLGMARSVFQEHLKKYETWSSASEVEKNVGVPQGVYDQRVLYCERKLLRDAYAESGGNKSQMAKTLRMPRMTLSERLRKFGISA